MGVESEIIKNTTSVEEILGRNPQGIILSGGPYSVYAERDKLGVCEELLEEDVPLLGICLGHQIIALHFGGKVSKGDTAEYAKVEIRILYEDDLFRGLPGKISVWESHRDEVSDMPKDFISLAESDACKFEAIKHKERPIYGVQFHPEVEHTPDGPNILKNFIKACGRS